MKLIIKIIIIFLISVTLNAREIGETEITTEDGIEVFQNEKFYLLKQKSIVRMVSIFQFVLVKILMDALNDQKYSLVLIQFSLVHKL